MTVSVKEAIQYRWYLYPSYQQSMRPTVGKASKEDRLKDPSQHILSKKIWERALVDDVNS
jgi:hypothetical protein